MPVVATTRDGYQNSSTTVFWASAARDAACGSDAVLEAKRRYDAQCYASLPTEVAPSLEDDAQAAHDAARDAAIEIERRVAAARATAEAKRRAAGRFRQPSRRTQTVVPPPTAATLSTFAMPAATAPQMPVPDLRERNDARAWRAIFAPPPPPPSVTIAPPPPRAATTRLPKHEAEARRAAAVPPAEGSTRYFVQVNYEPGPSRGLWRALYNDGIGKRAKFLGYYATDEIAARTRYDHIIDKGLERFNKMDVPDDATGLMVPRERKTPPKKKKRPPPPEAPVVVDGSESRSVRVRKTAKR